MQRHFNPATLGLVFITASIIAACGGGSKAPPSETPKDNLSTDIQKKFPVTLNKVAEGVWVHTSSYTFPGAKAVPSNGVVIEEADAVTLVDTAWGEAATLSLLEVIKSDIGKPVTKLVLTHHKFDRLAGVDVLEAHGATVYTHPETPALAAKIGGAVPNSSVAALKEPRSRTKVGSIEIAYPGPAHTQDNLVVYIPKDQILFASSVVKGAGAPSLGNTQEAQLKDWPASLNWVKQTYPQTKLVVPAHGKGSDLKLIDATLALLAKEVNAKSDEKAQKKK